MYKHLVNESVHNKPFNDRGWDKKHRAIVHMASAWRVTWTDLLDVTDMFVAYLKNERCKREPSGEGWKRTPYSQVMRWAMYLLAIRRGNRGCIRLPPNWKERLGEAGIDWRTMEVVEPLKAARCWKQFIEFDSFKIDRQREWNGMKVKAEWPPREQDWSVKKNKKAEKEEKKRKAEGKEEREEKVNVVDVTSRFRKRIMMEIEEE